MDLDAWINDPPSESEDESVITEARYDNTGLFYGGNTDNHNPNAYNNDTSSYQKQKNYVEPTADELEQQRQSRKQSEQINPFYLKDTKKTKLQQKVFIGIMIDKSQTLDYGVGGIIFFLSQFCPSIQGDRHRKNVLFDLRQLIIRYLSSGYLKLRGRD